MTRRIEIWRQGSDRDHAWVVDLFVDDGLSATTDCLKEPEWHRDPRHGEWCVALADPYRAYWAEELYVGGTRQEVPE